MPVGLIPVDDAAPVLSVDLHIDRSVRGAAVLDSSCPDPLENGIELFLHRHAGQVAETHRGGFEFVAVAVDLA